MATLVPTEILATILDLGVASCDHEDREAHALCVSQVSRFWRDIALATPALWTAVRVDYLLTGESQLRMLDLFLKRSRECPLDITIILVRDEDDDCWDELSELTSKIFPLISRWRSLVVCARFREDVFDALEDLGDAEASILETFCVDITLSGEEEENSYEPHLLFQGGAPRLTHIEIHKVLITTCQPPLSSLVSLHLHHPPCLISIDQYRDILLASHDLANLELVGDIVDIGELYMVAVPNVPKTDMITIPSLHSLTVSPSWSASSFMLYSLLASLETPALECLVLYCCPWKDHVSVFQEVFRHSGPWYPLLRSLTLKCAYFGEVKAMWFTLELPSITHISLINCTSSACFLALLLAGDHRPLADHHGPDTNTDDSGQGSSSGQDLSDSVHMPLLQDIYLSVFDLEGFDILCDIISQRISRGIPIASVQFGSSALGKIPMDKVGWLQERVHVNVC
jgi:hypothetical protein